MSSFLLNCPNCNTELEADDQDVGKNALCQICGSRFIIQKKEETSVPVVNAPDTVFSNVSQVEKKDSLPQKSISPLELKNKNFSQSTEYLLPPISLLSHSNNNCEENTEKISIIINSLEKVFESLGIPGTVADYTVAPQIINFEITLAPGVNVHKVEQNADNIAKSLAIPNVRIVAPIPGRSVIGVEVPKNELSDVYLRDILGSEQWRSSDAQLPIALGKNARNEPMLLDLATSSPMLIAGGSGSGKSVCVNSLIMSLILRFPPDELKFIMIDPSMVELNTYDTLPHLLTPIISHNLDKLPAVLEWTVKEMEKRYRLLSAVHVKSFSEFNKRPLSSFPDMDCDGNLIPEKMPALVFVMDSANDSIMAEIKNDVEKFITRIAQRGQRAGIYLVIVAQRPTVNVISGTIKANFLSTLCFKVRSPRDSLIAIDAAGGEKLLGNGDMLCQIFSTRSIERIQGAFTPTSDIVKAVDFASAQASPEFDKAVIGEDYDDEEEDWNFDDDDEDTPWNNDKVTVSALLKKYLRPGDGEVMRQALEVVLLERKASPSYLQRRLGIGYNRATELIDLMETRGIVGPPSGIGNKREILVVDDYDLDEASLPPEDNSLSTFKQKLCKEEVSVAEEKSFPQSSNVKDRGENSQKSIDSGYSPRSSAAKDGGPKEFLSQHSCGCLMYFIIWIIALVFLMYCTNYFGGAFLFSLAVPVGVFIGLCQSSGDEG